MGHRFFSDDLSTSVLFPFPAVFALLAGFVAFNACTEEETPGHEFVKPANELVLHSGITDEDMDEMVTSVNNLTVVLGEDVYPSDSSFTAGGKFGREAIDMENWWRR